MRHVKLHLAALLTFFVAAALAMSAASAYMGGAARDVAPLIVSVAALVALAGALTSFITMLIGVDD